MKFVRYQVPPQAHIAVAAHVGDGILPRDLVDRHLHAEAAITRVTAVTSDGACRIKLDVGEAVDARVQVEGGAGRVCHGDEIGVGGGLEVFGHQQHAPGLGALGVSEWTPTGIRKGGAIFPDIDGLGQTAKPQVPRRGAGGHTGFEVTYPFRADTRRSAARFERRLGGVKAGVAVGVGKLQAPEVLNVGITGHQAPSGRQRHVHQEIAHLTRIELVGPDHEAVGTLAGGRKIITRGVRQPLAAQIEIGVAGSDGQGVAPGPGGQRGRCDAEPIPPGGAVGMLIDITPGVSGAGIPDERNGGIAG